MAWIRYDLCPLPIDVPPTSDAAEKKEEFSAPPAEEKSDIQLEPTQDEMEQERLTSKAEQVKNGAPSSPS